MIDPGVARRYFYLKGHALQLAKAFDLSEASYQRLFDDGLIPLDQFLTGVHGRVVTHDLERAFTQAARATCFPRRQSRDSYPTIDSILDLATEQLKLRLQEGRQTLLEQLAAGGAVIQPVLGTLILPESGIRMPDGDGKMRTPRFAPKTAQLMRALVRMGIFADDLVVYVGNVLPTAMREVSYTILDIPRIGRQIAVCDQIGEITLVAKAQLPISLWGGLTKTQLKARPDVVPVRYNRGWLEAVETALLDGGAIQPSACSKVPVRRQNRTPMLTEAMIVEWLRLFHEKEGDWPSSTDARPVWEKTVDDEWFANSLESWRNLDVSLRTGARGLERRTIFINGRERPLSIQQLRYSSGLCQVLSEEQIRIWAIFYHEKEGIWPSLVSTAVWTKDRSGDWQQVLGESWGAIHSALRSGTRGLPGGSSLADFKKRHDFTDPLTEEQIVTLFKCYKEKEQCWPSEASSIVWDRTADGSWFQRNDTWTALLQALRKGSRGLARGVSVKDFRLEHDLHDDFSEAKLTRWFKLFRCKEGRWPTYKDRVIWDQDHGGAWVEVGDSWLNVHEALKSGRRGFTGGSTLVKFREQHGLTDTFSENEIVRLIKLFVEKEGQYPTTASKRPVWDRAPDGQWVVVPTSWYRLDKVLAQGLEDSPSGTHLRSLRDADLELRKLGAIPTARRPESIRRSAMRRLQKKHGD